MAAYQGDASAHPASPPESNARIVMPIHTRDESPMTRAVSLPSALSGACHRIVACLLLLLCISPAPAAEPVGWNDLSDPVFQRAVLPEPVFSTAMLQDDQGFLWLGT